MTEIAGKTNESDDFKKRLGRRFPRDIKAIYFFEMVFG